MPEENKATEPKKTTAKTPVVAIQPFSLSGNPNGERFHSDQISDMGVTGTIHSALGNTDFGNSKYDDLSTKTEHIESGDYEFMRGERQSALTQIGSGVARVGLKAVVELLKTPAYIYALGEAAMTDKTLDQTLDNAYLNGLEGAENSWKAAGSPLAVHKSFKSGKGGLMDNIASTSFWASEGADGVGYMVGMVGGSYGVGLLGLAPKFAKVALKLGVKNALKASSIGAKLELGVQTTLNTATESLAEAKGVGDRIRNDFKDMLNPESQNYNPINPATGKNWTEQEVASSIADGSKSTFYLNTLILFGPNMIMNKNLLGRFNKDKKLLDHFRDGSGKLSINPLLKKQFIKDYSKALGIAMVSEGAVEEGGQFSIENYEVKRATGKTSDNLIKGLIKEYGNTWNSLEGQKSILLGSVIGGLAGVAGQYRKNKQLSELKPVINKMIANNFTGVMDNLDIFERDDNNRIKNDNNNQPVLNEQKALAYFYSLANEAGESQVRDLAAFDSNKLLYDYIAHKQFVRWSSQFIQQGDLGLEILDEHIDNAANTQEIIDKKDLSLGQGTSFSEAGYKQQLKKKARDLHASYNETLDVLKGLPFLEEFTKNNPKEAGDYINDLANAVYQENAKQVFYKEKIQDLSKELMELNSSLSSDLPQNQAVAEKIRKDVANTVLLLEKSKEDYKSIFSEEQQILAFNQHIKDSKVEEEISKESRKFATGSNIADGENKTNDQGDQSAEIINYNNNNTEKLNTINNFADFNLLKEEAKASPYHNTETSKQFAAKEKQLNDAVDVFANAIIKNTVESTPENQEFFANNSKEIEAKVQQLKDAAMPKKSFNELLADQGIVNEEMPPVLTKEEIDEEQEIVSLANIQGSYSSNEKTQNETQESLNSIQAEKGINARVNVIMVHLFEHFFDNKVFRFVRDIFGFPKIDNYSKINITALNALKKGDKVTLELVKLTKDKDDLYKFFKDDQNNFIPVNHIAIKHNGELVGFVMQPHPVSVESLDPAKSEELRNQLIDYRKKVISLINQGITVTEEVEAKGTGNLYTKLKEKNSKEPAGSKFIDNKFDVFSDSRPQDKADGSLIFVYANAEGKIKLPDSSVSDLNASDIITINKRLNEFLKFRTKPGQVYQLVKDLTGQWSPIPVYANNINDKTTDAIEEILNTFDDSSNEKDIVRALQPYVYSSTHKQGAMLLVWRKNGKIIISSNGNDISLNDFNSSTSLTKEFLSGMKGLAQNIDITNINNPVVQQKMADRGTLITNVTTFNGEYFVQPYVEFSFNSMTEEKPAITDNQINKLSAVQPLPTPSTPVSTDAKAEIERINEAKDLHIELFRDFTTHNLNKKLVRESLSTNALEQEKNKWSTEEEAQKAIDDEIELVSEKIEYWINKGLSADEIIKKIMPPLTYTGNPLRFMLINGKQRIINFIKAKVNGKVNFTLQEAHKTSEKEINAKYNLELAALEQPSKVTTEEDDFLNDLNDIKNVKIDENGAASKSIDNTVLNRVLFEKWLKKNLPQLSLSEITDINELKDTIIDAFGLFKDSTIFLFEGAGNKTAYHEAFHGVFRNLLTVKQREELINEAKTKYPAPTLEDLNNLQKDLKNQYTEQQLTNLYYEEQIADAFAIFSNDKNSKSLLGKLSDAIVRFFNKILRYFNLLQNNDLSKIENLFDNINNGKLATMKSKSNSVVNIPIFSEYAYSKVLNEQLTVSIAAATVKTVGDLFMAKYQNNLISNKKTSPVEAFQSIVDDYIAKFKTLPKGSVDKAVCGKIILNFPELIIEAKKYLSSRSVKIKSKISYTEKIGTLTSLEDNSSVEFFNELELNKLSDYEVNTMESKAVKGLAEWTSISGLSSASARLRLFLSSIPVLSTRKSNGAYTSLTDRFGMQIYHDFNELYTYIEDNLIDLYEFEEQIEKLQELSVNRPELKQVIDKLTNKSSDYNNDQFNLLQNDFNTNFSKQQLEYSLPKFDTDAATGQTTIRIIDANRVSLGKQISDKWKSNVFDNNRNTIGSYNDQKESVINVAKAKRLEDSWNGLPEKPKASVVNAKLLQAGIEYSDSALNQLVEQNDPEWKKDVSIVLNYYSSNLNPANEKAFREALYRLVSKEVELVPSRHSKSFISGTNENIFTVQLPSFISKTIAKIKNVGKFKTWSNELSKDLFYKNSGILKMLKGNSAFRLKLKVSYIDALKDERGTREGVHFTDMTPKDYAACQIAYFQNIAVNKQKDIAGIINKYFYIIPTDKSMQVIIDSTSTQAKVDSNGKLLVTKSPIIHNGQDKLSYYNHFLQEAHRIKVNLDIKNDIILNKGKGKHKLNSLLENYHMSKDNFTELSKLILKDELSEEDVKQLSNMFNGFAYKFNYFSNDFNKNVLPSLMKIIDSSTIDNLESNLDSNDNVQFKGNVINAIAKEIQSDFNKTLEEMIDNGVILYNEKTKLYSSKIITLEEETDVINGQEVKIQRTEQQINDDILNVLVNFSANTKLNNMEFSNIFNGDIAQYKAKELGKRTPQSQAMTVFGRFKNKIMKTRVVKDFYYKLDKEKRDDIYNSLIDNGLSPEEAKEIIDQYLNVNTTDAQVYISPELYKRIHESRGTWTPLMQEAYDIAESGDKKAMTPEIRRQLLGIKPFYFGNRFNEDLGIMQFEQVKCSMIPLFKSYTDLNPLLADIRKDMLKKDKNGNTTLDMVAHESAFKDALGFRNDIFDSTGSVTLDLNTDNFGIQVDNVDHIEGGNDSTRQLKMLILGTVDKNKTYRGVPGSEIIETITKLEATNIRTSLAELKTKLDIKNNAEFGTFIADAITKRNATVNVEESLSLEDGDFKYALDGSLSVQIENLISSVYTSNAIKQEFEVGGDAVQATSLGFQVKSKFKNLLEQQKNLTKDQLTIQKRLEWIKPNKENGYIEFAECAMPAWTSKFFDEKGFLIDAENIPEALRQLIIYRIPTEGLHSMLPIRVVEFLPPTMGNFILLPLEITKQFGSDFDFDKVYFIGKDFYKTINENKEVVFEEYKYYANEEDTALRYGQYIRYANKKRIYPMDFEFFAKLPIEEQNPKASRDNEIINQYFNILTELSNLNLLIKPSGFDAFVDFKNDNFETKQEVDFFSSSNQREIKKRSHTSITIKGQAALHVSGHSFGVLMDLNTASYIKEKQKDGTYKSYLDLNKTINIDGKKRTDFHKLYNDSGKLIANELGSLLAATLDDLKFDILAYLNINSYTIDTLATIMRSGVTTNDSLTFIGQPALKELAKALEGNENKIKEFNQGRIDVDTLISIYKNKAKSILDKLEDRDNPEVSDLYDKIEDPNFYVSTKEIFKYVNNFDFNEFEKTASPKELLNYFSNQARVLIQFKSAEIISKELVKANKFFAINKEVGPNIEDIISKQYILEDLENSKILNGFDLERNPSLNETWKVHLDALQWFGSYFPYGSESYKGVKEMFAFQQGSKNISEYPVKDRQYMNSFIRTFVDHGSDLFKDVNKEYDNLLKTLPALVNKIFAFTDEEMFLGTISYNSLRNNPFLKELKEYNDKDNDNYYLQLKGTRLELQIKNNVIAGLTALYNSVDPEVKNFAIDLIKHSFLTTGFFKGINSFSTLINPEILNELGYNQFRKNVIEELRIKGPLLSEKTIVEEMIMNNPRAFSKTFDPIMFIEDSTEGLPSTITTNINLINAAKRTGDMQWTDEDGVTRNPMIISVIDKAKKMIKLFKRNDNVGISNDMNEVANIVYNEITPLGKNGCVIEINILETPKKSQLPDNDRGISSTDESNDIPDKTTTVIPDGKNTEEVVTEVNVATENKESPLPTTQSSTSVKEDVEIPEKLKNIVYESGKEKEDYEIALVDGVPTFIVTNTVPTKLFKGFKVFYSDYAGGQGLFKRSGKKVTIPGFEDIQLVMEQGTNNVFELSTGLGMPNTKLTIQKEILAELEILFKEKNVRSVIEKTKKINANNPNVIIEQNKNSQSSTNIKSNLSNINTNNSLFRPDTKIKEKHFKNSNTVKVSEILDTISESNHPLSALAARLKSFSSINNVNVNLLPVNSFTKEVEIESAAYFSVDKNEINIAEFTNVKKGESEALLLHEILHALSYNALRKNGEYNEDFKKLYNYSIDKLKGFDVESEKGTYANHTIDEFFVSLFTDSNFIKQLKELPPIDIKKSNNLFEEIFDMILKYLGIEKGDSAYKQAFSVATNILEEERFNVNRSEDLFEMQKYEDSLNLNIETLDSPKFIDWYNNELQNNPDLDAEEALEYYKKCKS